MVKITNTTADYLQIMLSFKLQLKSVGWNASKNSTIFVADLSVMDVEDVPFVPVLCSSDSPAYIALRSPQLLWVCYLVVVKLIVATKVQPLLPTYLYLIIGDLFCSKKTSACKIMQISLSCSCEGGDTLIMSLSPMYKFPTHCI